MAKSHGQTNLTNYQAPRSIESEIAVIGSILLDPEVMGDVADILRPADFYAPSNAAIARVIFDLWGTTNNPIDVMLIHNELCNRKQDAMVGGHDGLIKIIDAVPEASHAVHYAKIVRDKARLRNLIKICRIATANAISGADDTDGIIEDAYNEVYQLASNTTKSSMLEYNAAMEIELDELRRGAPTRHAIWTGYADLDAATGGIHNGEYTILAAYPGMGKTSLALNIVEHLSRKDMVSVIFSLEVPCRQVLRNLTAIGAHVPVIKFRNQTLDKNDIDNLERTWRHIKKNVIWITGRPAHLKNMQKELEKLTTRFPISLVVFDYIQLLLESKDSRAGEMSVISSQFKMMAQQLDLPFLILSQLRRPQPGREAELPTLSQLRESGSLEQDADMVLILHRVDAYRKKEERDHCAKLHIAKQKNGPTPQMWLYFKEDILRFESLAEDEADALIKNIAAHHTIRKVEQRMAERLPYKEPPENGFEIAEDGLPKWNGEEPQF